MKICKTQKGNILETAESVPNHHVVSIGKSGTGKSSANANIAINQQDRIVIIIDYHNSFDKSTLTESNKNYFNKNSFTIDVAEEGIPINLFDPIIETDIENESMIERRITKMLSNATGLSRTQEDITFLAVQDVLQLELYHDEGLSAITRWLRSQDKSVANCAAGKLRSICDTGILYDESFWKSDKKIYYLNMNGLDYCEQSVWVNFLMDYFMRVAMRGFFKNKGVTFYLDEVQNLDFREGSTMFTMINESRKFNVNLVMAAPSLFMKKELEILGQCGTILFFHPLQNDKKKVASLIDSQKMEKYVFRLSQLNVGECIVCGTFKCKGETVTKPLQIAIDL
ncbi:MAG: ATP-binding protein [Lachnospiraceae bacterium]|nr:ATP-binding protein [Lachnospiraceae bacterium]